MSSIKDQQQQFNFNSQAALIYYIEEIIAKWNTEYGNKGDNSLDFRKKGTLQLANYRNFHCVRSDREMTNLQSGNGPDITSVKPSKFFSLIGKTKEFSILFSNFKPKLRDSIICNVDVYKTFIIDNVEYDWKIPLNEGAHFNYQNGALKQQFEIRTEKLENKNSPLGRNVAISSFSYEYKGTNDFEVETNLEASLELKFGDPTLLLEKINTSIGDNVDRFSVIPPYGGGEIGPYFSFSDLITNVPTDFNNSQINFDDYRIKVVIKFDTKLTEEQFNKFSSNALSLETSPAGNEVLSSFDPTSNSSSPPPNNQKKTIGFDDFSSFKKLLNKCSTYLYLIPASHYVSIDQQNLLTVKINYIASNAGLLHSPKKANILDIATYETAMLKQYKDQLEKLEKDLNEKKENEINSRKIEGDANTEEKKKKFDEEFKETYKQEYKQKQILERTIQIQKSQVYSGVINRLIGNDLYRIQIPNESLGIKMDLTPTVGNHPDDTGGNTIDTASVEKTSVITKRKQITSFIKYPSFDLLNYINKNLGNTVVGIEAYDVKVLGNYLGTGDWTKEQLDAKIKAFEENLKKNADLDKIQNSDIQTISFFFLGDLLDIILDCLNSIEPKSSKPVLLFGNISLKLPVNVIDANETSVVATKNVCINIADIPITFNLLTKFWSSLIESKPDSITVHTFFFELIDRLLKPVLGPKYFEQYDIANKLKIATTTFSLPNNTNKKDILTDSTPDTRNGPLNSKIIINNYNTLINSGLYDQLALDNGLTTYISFYDISTTRNIVENNGDTIKDSEDGIYHFSLNTGDSIIKKINFSRVDIPGIREALAVQEGSNKNALAYKQAYKVEIHLIPGLTVYKPGDMIFVDPYLFANEKVAYLSNALGFVGYYLITSARYEMSKASIPTAVITGRLHAWINSSGKVVSVKGE
jgi:hypothetical protein